MSKPLILIVEENARKASQVAKKLHSTYETLISTTTTDAFIQFERHHLKIRVVLISTIFPESDVLKLLKDMKELSILPEIILLAETENIRLAIDAMKTGAFDVILNPYYNKNLGVAIESALQNADSINKIEAYSKKNLFDQYDLDRRLFESQELITNHRKTTEDPFPVDQLLSLFPTSDKRQHVSVKKLKNELNQKLQENMLNKSASVLIVEDEAPYREMLVQFLKKDYSLFEAENGEQALKISEKENIDVVLLDILLPDISGIDLVSKIKERQPEAEIIILTAFELLDVAVKTLKEGACDFLNKPILKDQLLESVSQAFYRKHLRALLPSFSEQFLDNNLSYQGKISILEDLIQSRTTMDKKIIMEDIYTFFPELKTTCIPDKTSIPKSVIEKGISTFIKELKEQIKHFNPMAGEV